MTWVLDNNMPIYLQLMGRIQRDIISGRYGPGDKLPSVRELAVEAAVNPNTMQKAMSELERSGLVYSQRTSGRFITEDEELLKELKKEQAARYLEEFIESMHNLGLKNDEIRILFEDAMKGEKEEGNRFWNVMVYQSLMEMGDGPCRI